LDSLTAPRNRYISNRTGKDRDAPHYELALMAAYR
jgi:hypothetical protein